MAISTADNLFRKTVAEYPPALFLIIPRLLSRQIKKSAPLADQNDRTRETEILS